MPKKEDDFYDQTVSASADFLKCAGTTVVRYADAGKIPHKRDSAGRRLFRLSDLKRVKKLYTFGVRSRANLKSRQ